MNAVTIELTAQQHEALVGSDAVRAIDPVTNTEYVLVRADLFERVKSLFAEDRDWQEGAQAIAMQVFARDGWDDPRMAVYDGLDPRKAQ